MGPFHSCFVGWSLILGYNNVSMIIVDGILLRKCDIETCVISILYWIQTWSEGASEVKVKYTKSSK